MIAFADYGRKSQSWRLIEAKSHAILAQDTNPYESADIVGQGRTAGTVIYEMPDEDGTAQYFESALAKGAPQTRLFEDKQIAQLLHDHRTGLLNGVVIEGDSPDIEFFDAQRQANWKSTKKAFPNLNAALEFIRRRLPAPPRLHRRRGRFRAPTGRWT